MQPAPTSPDQFDASEANSLATNPPLGYLEIRSGMQRDIPSPVIIDGSELIEYRAMSTSFDTGEGVIALPLSEPLAHPHSPLPCPQQEGSVAKNSGPLL